VFIEETSPGIATSTCELIVSSPQRTIKVRNIDRSISHRQVPKPRRVHNCRTHRALRKENVNQPNEDTKKTYFRSLFVSRPIPTFRSRWQRILWLNLRITMCPLSRDSSCSVCIRHWTLWLKSLRKNNEKPSSSESKVNNLPIIEDWD